MLLYSTRLMDPLMLTLEYLQGQSLGSTSTMIFVKSILTVKATNAQNEQHIALLAPSNLAPISLLLPIACTLHPHSSPSLWAMEFLCLPWITRLVNLFLLVQM